MRIVQALNQAILQIEGVKDYYTITIPAIEMHSNETMQKNRIGYLLQQYAHISTLGDEHAELRDKFLDAFNKIIDIISEEKTAERFSMTFKFKAVEDDEQRDIVEFNTSAEEYKKARDMMHMHICNVIMLIIIKFEQFMSDIFRTLIEKYPEKYLSGRQMKYSDIVEKNIGEIKEELIQKELDSIMYKPYTEWFEEIKSYNVKVELDDETLNDLREAYYRRNIIVHNNCVVNKQYLNGIDETKHPKPCLNTLIKPDNEYVVHLFNVIQIIMYSITIGLLKLSRGEDACREIETLFDMGFRHLRREEWILSEYIFRNLKQQKMADAQTRAMSLVNYWISTINLEGYESVNSEIQSYDFSAHNNQFLLAKEVLLCKFDSVNQMLATLFPSTISPMELESWPLFFDYRKTQQYISFKEQNAKEFDLQKFTQTQSDLDEKRQEESITGTCECPSS